MRDGSSRCDAHQVRVGAFADRTRGTRQERGYGAAWTRTRERVLARDGGLCQPCLRHGLVHVGKDVDHRIPRAQGGNDDDGNLQTICRAVHKAKTAVEAKGRAWDEAAHYASAGACSAGAPTAAPRGGSQISGGPAQDRTSVV